jgi:hypothetical protein
MAARKIFVRVWKALSTTDTLVGIAGWSLWKLAMAALAVVTAAIVAWVTSVPVWAWFLLIMAGIGGFLFITNEWASSRMRIRQRRAASQVNTPLRDEIECSREHITSEQKYRLNSWPEDRRLADVYRTLLNIEDDNRHLLIQIEKDSPTDWDHIWPSLGAGYIDLHLKIRTFTILTLTLKDAPTERITYRIANWPGQGKMDRSPEWIDTKGELRLGRGQWVPFTLRQWLHSDVMSNLQGAVGKAVTIDASNVHLIASATAPDGSKRQSWDITLPPAWTEDGPPRYPSLE